MSATSGDVYDLDVVVSEILNESGRLQRRTIVMSESAIVATTPTIHISYALPVTTLNCKICSTFLAFVFNVYAKAQVVVKKSRYIMHTVSLRRKNNNYNTILFNHLS